MPTAKISHDRVQQYRQMKREVEEAEQRFRDFKCGCMEEAPVKIGDRVEVNECFGRGNVMEVTDLELTECVEGELVWIALGRMLKKDGNPGRRRGWLTWKIEP